MTTQTSTNRDAGTVSGINPSSNPTIRGTATVVFCYDVGFGVDLTRAADILAASAALPNPLREQLPQRRRAPKHFTFDPAPVRVLEPCPDVELAALAGATHVSLVPTTLRRIDA